MLTLTIKRVCARDKKGLRSRWKTQKLVKRNEEMAIWRIAFCCIRLNNSVFRCVLLALRRLCVCRACLFLVWKGLLCCPRRQMVCRSSPLCLSAFSFVCFFVIHDESRQATRRKQRDRFFFLLIKRMVVMKRKWGLGLDKEGFSMADANRQEVGLHCRVGNEPFGCSRFAHRRSKKTTTSYGREVVVGKKRIVSRK